MASPARGSCHRASASSSPWSAWSAVWFVPRERAGAWVGVLSVVGLAVAPHLRAAVPRAGDARHPARGCPDRRDLHRDVLLRRGVGRDRSSSPSRCAGRGSRGDVPAARHRPGDRGNTARRMTPHAAIGIEPGQQVRAAPRRPARPPHARTTGQVLLPPARAAALPGGRRLEHGLRVRRVGADAVPARRLPELPRHHRAVVADRGAQRLPRLPLHRVPQPGFGAQGAAALLARLRRGAPREPRPAAHRPAGAAVQHLRRPGAVHRRRRRLQLPGPQVLQLPRRACAETPATRPPTIPRP